MHTFMYYVMKSIVRFGIQDVGILPTLHASYNVTVSEASYSNVRRCDVISLEINRRSVTDVKVSHNITTTLCLFLLAWYCLAPIISTHNSPQFYYNTYGQTDRFTIYRRMILFYVGCELVTLNVRSVTRVVMALILEHRRWIWDGRGKCLFC